MFFPLQVFASCLRIYVTLFSKDNKCTEIYGGEAGAEIY